MRLGRRKRTIQIRNAKMRRRHPKGCADYLHQERAPMVTNAGFSMRGVRTRRRSAINLLRGNVGLAINAGTFTRRKMVEQSKDRLGVSLVLSLVTSLGRDRAGMG